MRITKRLMARIEKAPKVYLIACWAHWGVREYKWTGRWSITSGGVPVPIVYHYNDHNGEYEEYQKLPIHLTTTGLCMDWSFYKNAAQALADQMNEREFGRKEND